MVRTINEDVPLKLPEVQSLVRTYTNTTATLVSTITQIGTLQLRVHSSQQMCNTVAKGANTISCVTSGEHQAKNMQKRHSQVCVQPLVTATSQKGMER